MQRLIKGETYEVLESLMMTVLKGKLIGVEKSSSYIDNVQDILIFEMLDGKANSYKYFGAKWELTGKILEPNLRLRSCSYGNSSSELKRCGEYTPTKHIQIFAENEN